MYLCHCTLWSSSWACNKEQFFCWGVQQIARRGLCVSFSFLLCVSVSLCFSAFCVSCLRVSVCVCARCAWDCHRLFLMTCTEQYGDNGNMKRVLRHESFAQCACALCHSSDALCIVHVAVHSVILWMQYQLAAGASTHADVAAMHDGIAHLIEWRNLMRDGFALSIYYLDTGGTVDDTLRMQQIVSTQTAHAQWIVGWCNHS